MRLEGCTFKYKNNAFVFVSTANGNHNKFYIFQLLLTQCGRDPVNDNVWGGF